MELKPEENQKQFVIHSDGNHEWFYNGRDSVSISFDSGIYFSTRNTIHWRGNTFHVRILIPKRLSMSTYAYYYIIFNEKIYCPRIVGHYAFRGNIQDNPPTIENDKYYVKIFCGLKSFSLTEIIKPTETTSSVLEKNNKPKEISEAILEKDNKPLKFSDKLKRLFSQKQVLEKIEQEKSETKKIYSAKEDKLFRVCPFTIVKASDEIIFNYPEERKESLEICTNKVTLYEVSGANVYVNSYAYFEQNDLVVDFWKLGNRYEDEDFIIVKERFVPLVFKEFKITSENKSELLIGILNAFNGKDCYEKYEGFLKSKNIPYGFEVRHDDEIGG